MNQHDLEHLETQAAEMLGAMKDLFKEFERHLGEMVSSQRMASTEARAESTQVRKDLNDLRISARNMVSDHRELLSRIEREWQLRIDANAQRAGETHAQAFGAGVAQGLERQLAGLIGEVKTVTRTLSWRSSLQWALGIAIAIPLTVGISLIILSPQAEPRIERTAAEKPAVNKPGIGLPGVVGITAAQTREAASKLSLCEVPKTNDWHVCIEVDSPPRVGLGSPEKPRMVVRGM
jgi:hypothetical protein